MNFEQPLVTIRCTAYNHESYIRQCLEGFVMQKTNFRFEAIVHDDASPDKTADIIREYSEEYPDIIVPIFENENQYSKKDGSIGRIMLPYLKGKYIALCEGDDYWIDPYKLQRQVDFLEGHPEYSMCFHNAFVLKSRGDLLGAKLFSNYSQDCDLTPREALFNWVVPTASILVRRDAIIPTQGWVVNRPWADISYIFQSLVKGKVRYLNFVGSVYRQVMMGGTSATATILASNFYENNKQIVSSLSSLDIEISEVAKERLAYLEKEQRFTRLLKKSKLLCFLTMPNYLLKRVVHRLRKIQSICWLY